MARRLILLALALACIVIVLGAYVRLSDAGLGCPDWPGCYGQLTPHHASEEIAAAVAADPHGPVSLPKAWKEMVHRYLATTLGLLILAIALLALRRKARGVSAGMALATVGTVVFQGMLGMWTVTLLLKPAIVTGHLVGGLATVSMLAWMAMRTSHARPVEIAPQVRHLARLGLLALAVQILLGGWTSTNYAALACADLPTCQGQWLPQMDFANAFHMVRELGMTADGQLLPLAALTAIHWCHRIGAVVVSVLLMALAVGLLKRARTRGLGLLLVLMLLVQVSLGVANVLLQLPLPLAVAHNAGALLLWLTMLRINFSLRPAHAMMLVGRSSRENALA
ncbi:COX15/CtaA family protein [Niveibacterium sp. SC-1]|uniref:COX15/CtaA family protein n=1 Tax=Niveibacterium sp. SC-1 TaxID=3135646 RepID=UPI00311F774D